MKAVTVVPGAAGSARLAAVPEPDAALGSVVVEALAVGICGTDTEIASGSYGWPPPGRDRLILGHESLGRVIDPGPSGFTIGEHVVGIVRRPDPAPCPSCAVGEWDMCSNGGYTERGIKQADGFMAERWRIEPDYAVRVDQGLGYLGVLLEPTTVVAKAWEHIAAIGRRTFWDPHTVLIIGAGPIGLLAALIGVQQGADVHVLDRVTSGPKPALVKQLGATYHTGDHFARRHHLPDRSRPPRGARHSLGSDAGDRDGAQKHRRVRLGERQPAALLPRGDGSRRRGPVLARAARDPARPSRPGPAGAPAGT
jgi:threonine dehydrogenase-like Zn-dependent dehydrogenase